VIAISLKLQAGLLLTNTLAMVVLLFVFNTPGILKWLFLGIAIGVFMLVAMYYLVICKAIKHKE
jgi:hypothetical protein